jgi:hypothetical protein
MNQYALRTTPDLWTTLIINGITLGAIQQDEDGNVSATQGGAWDYIGEIHQPTGATDEEGAPITAPITDEQGTPYLHANLKTPLDLLKVAQQMASQDQAIADGLANLSSFFIINPNTGKARLPNSPVRTWL